jgi:hypothetical protein
VQLSKQGDTLRNIASIACWLFAASAFGQIATVTSLTVFRTACRSMGSASCFTGTIIYAILFLGTGNRVLKTAFGGWQLNAITTLQSGTPFNLSMNTDAANTSAQGPQRPDLLKTPVYDCGGGHLLACIDKSAFTVPGNIAQGIFAYGTIGARHSPRAEALGHGPLTVQDVFVHRARQVHVWMGDIQCLEPSFVQHSERKYRVRYLRQHHQYLGGLQGDAVRW